jgi:hypothetical protein
MQLLAKDIKIIPNNDTQVEVVYEMDHILESLLELRKPSLDKLYGDLSKDSDIIELTKKIYADFNLENMSSVKMSRHLTTSSYRFYSISYSKYHYDKNCIEVVLHEVAHLFCSVIFSLHSEKHGALFASVLKWLFNYYGLLDSVDFDIANDLLRKGKVKFSDDSICHIEALSKEKAEEILNKYKFESDSRLNNTKKYTYTDISNCTQHCLWKEEEGKGIYTIRKLFGYEIEDLKYSLMDKASLENFVLYTPIYVMDSSGYQVTAKHHWAGSEGLKAYSVEECEETNRLVIMKNIIRNYDRKEIKSELKEMVNFSKRTGQKYKRCTTISQYESILKQIEKAIWIYNKNL